MTDTVTLNVISTDQSTRKETIQVSNKDLIKCVFPSFNGKDITSVGYNKLVTIAKAGDQKVLEESDLSPAQKMKQFYLNGYDNAYEIKLSKDGKSYEITVKPTGMLHPDPQIYHIKKDFGLKENVFLDNNRNLVGEHPDDSESGNYNFNKIKGGTTFKIPVNEAHFSAGVSGFWGRLFAVG